jgi:hypothetical protein
MVELTEIKKGIIIHLPQVFEISKTLPALTIFPVNPVSSLTSLNTALSAVSPSPINPETGCHLPGDVYLFWVRFKRSILSSNSTAPITVAYVFVSLDYIKL